MRTRRIRAILVSLLAAATALAAGASIATSAKKSAKVGVIEKGGMFFSINGKKIKKNGVYKAKKGDVITFAFRNNGKIKHNLVFKGGPKTPILAGGKTAKPITVKATKDLTFLCTVPGHAAAGMQGKLDV